MSRDIAEYFTSHAPVPDLSRHDWTTEPVVPCNPALVDIPLLVEKHPDTPLVNAATGSELSDVVREALSGNADYNNAEFFEYVRQLGRTNLWFLMQAILAHNGPFELVNDHLHMDMANFRQSRIWRAPGARAAAFLPRGHLKTTVFTIAGIIFDLLRNPDERHLLINANMDKAMNFMHGVQQPFENNELFQALYWEWCPYDQRNTGKDFMWKRTEFVVPCREREYKDPSVKPFGVTSAQEGSHADSIDIDDLVGLDDISNNRASNENMRRARNFFTTADPALLVTKRRSRIGYIGTRWAIDDVGELIVGNAQKFYGNNDPDFEERPKAPWHVYYRQCIENGIPIYPDEWENSDFEELARADWWNFTTQYMNKPTAAGMVEFGDYDVKRASLDVHGGEYYLSYEDADSVRLGDCNCVLTLDPAGTEREINAKTSRTSLGAWALDGYGRYTRFWGRVGYMDAVQMIDYIFLAHNTFPGVLLATVVESNAMQKILLPIIRKEEVRRGRSVRPRGIPATGDKVARIRNALSLPLARGMVYATEGEHTWLAFNEEMKIFPSSTTRRDVLDESEKAFSFLRKPLTAEERVLDELEDEDDNVLYSIDGIYESRVRY